jgi:hypothetical protein
MNHHFSAFFAGPGAARRNHRHGPTRLSGDDYTGKEEYLNEEFFDGFAAGPRSARW